MFEGVKPEKRHNKLAEPIDLISHVIVVLSCALPQKAQDTGDPRIPIQIGKFKIKRALLNLGACVSILLGSLYDQYDSGPSKKFDTPVVLADQTPMHPRGMVEDVIVKVEDFYYPVDFLVVNYVECVEDTQPIVILGRLFLATANAIISCATGTMSMKFGDWKQILNVFPKFTNPLGGDKCPKKDMNPNKKVCAMVDRFGESKKKPVKKKKVKNSPQEEEGRGRIEETCCCIVLLVILRFFICFMFAFCFLFK
ncbi:putative aspartic peptidase domain superfamily [Helianthus debilis subsp. tardiflorus]